MPLGFATHSLSAKSDYFPVDVIRIEIDHYIGYCLYSYLPVALRNHPDSRNPVLHDEIESCFRHQGNPLPEQRPYLFTGVHVRLPVVQTITLPAETVIHLRLRNVALMAECREVRHLVVPSIHQGPAVIYLKVVCAGADNALVAVPGENPLPQTA